MSQKSPILNCNNNINYNIWHAEIAANAAKVNAAANAAITAMTLELTANC